MQLRQAITFSLLLGFSHRYRSFSTIVMKSLSRIKESSYSSNHTYVIGIDEAGRGPLAGPVVAASCLIPKNEPLIDGITDSKLIKEIDREKLYEIITTNKNIFWSVSVISPEEIDEINILQASLKAMRESTISLLSTHKKITINETVALVDGNKIPSDMPIYTEAIIKGDSNIYSIAAASILAKVTRDRIMIDLHEKYPLYNFIQHKGYPTREHEKLLNKFGPSPIHRYSYRPVALAAEKFKNIYNKNDNIVTNIDDNIGSVMVTIESNNENGLRRSKRLKSKK